MHYTQRELMVVAAAREIRDGEMVFVGMRLPLLSFAVAKELHAPRSIGIFENGVIRDRPALESIFTISDPPNVAPPPPSCGLFGWRARVVNGAGGRGVLGGGGGGTA